MPKNNLNKRNISDETSLKGKYKITTFKAGTKEVLRETEDIHNLIVSSNGYGKNIIARQLLGDTTYAIEIDSAGIGDDNTAPTVNDTALGNEVLGGISIATSSVANNVIDIDFFITDAELTNGTYEEFGLKQNGRLFARSIISPAYTKASNEDTLISYTITL